MPEPRIPRRSMLRPSRDDEHLAVLLGAVDNLNDNLGQLAAGVKTLRGVQLQGAEPRVLQQTSAPQKVSSSAGRLIGWNVFSPTTAGVFFLRDGADASGDLLAIIDTNNTGKTDRQWPAKGVSFALGLFLDIPGAGDVQGVVYLDRSPVR